MGHLLAEEGTEKRRKHTVLQRCMHPCVRRQCTALSHIRAHLAHVGALLGLAGGAHERHVHQRPKLQGVEVPVQRRVDYLLYLPLLGQRQGLKTANSTVQYSTLTAYSTVEQEDARPNSTVSLSVLS